jgi:hypothetical protein
MLSTCALVQAATASKTEQARIAAATATYIRDSGPGPFKTKDVELGPTVIEHPWAIANWRSTDASTNGQVLFRYLCDDWYVAGVTVGAFNVRELAGRGVPSDKASALVADLSQAQRVAYTRIGPPGATC